MRLSKTTSHAIRILIDCAEANEKLVKTADISVRLDITPDNVFKIVHILSRAGFVEAVRGRNGGVRLSKPATDIRIGDIVRAIEATEMAVAGVGKSKPVGKKAAAPQLNLIFDHALDAFISVLDQHSLADMSKASRKSAQRGAKAPPKLRSRIVKASAKNGPVIRG